MGVYFTEFEIIISNTNLTQGQVYAVLQRGLPYYHFDGGYGAYDTEPHRCELFIMTSEDFQPGGITYADTRPAEFYLSVMTLSYNRLPLEYHLGLARMIAQDMFCTLEQRGLQVVFISGELQWQVT